MDLIAVRDKHADVGGTWVVPQLLYHRNFTLGGCADALLSAASDVEWAQYDITANVEVQPYTQAIDAAERYGLAHGLGIPDHVLHRQVQAVELRSID